MLLIQIQSKSLINETNLSTAQQILQNIMKWKEMLIFKDNK